MTMIFSLHDSIAPNGLEVVDLASRREEQGATTLNCAAPISTHKTTVPLADHIERPRLNELLLRSMQTYPSTLLCGRAGTGKTSMAAAMARTLDNCCWYSVDSTDTDWKVFSTGFATAVRGKNRHDWGSVTTRMPGQEEMARLLVNLFLTRYSGHPDTPSLIVLDDIHHIFDASWFEPFFHLLLYSLPNESHLLLLCRSKPPNPLWRLRSKQMLNVVDEKVLLCDLDETSKLFGSFGLPSSAAIEAHRESYGRISNLLQWAANASENAH